MNKNENGLGYLKVRVFSGDGAVPLENAVVLVFSDTSDEGGTLCASLRTDTSGITQTVSIPCPPEYLSQSSENEKPYSTVSIRTSLSGFYSVDNVGVSVFDRQTSIQGVNMVPMNENVYPPDKTVIINEEVRDSL